MDNLINSLLAVFCAVVWMLMMKAVLKPNKEKEIKDEPEID